MIRRRGLLVLITTLLVLVPALPAAPTLWIVPAGPTLLVSDHADRSETRALNATTLSGAVAIHFDRIEDAQTPRWFSWLPGRDAIRNRFAKVQFYLDNTRAEGSPTTTDLAFPYDFNGTAPNAAGCTTCPDSLAVLYDTAALAPGSHTITAVAWPRFGFGGKVKVTATFEVKRSAIELAPPPVEMGVATSVAEATEFLYTGTNPPQEGVEPNTIVAERASVVRGRVTGRAGQPIVNATASVLDHPEYGTTRTRADGWFDLAVNGGATLTIHLEKEGFVLAQRQVQVGWGDYGLIDVVVLVPFDPSVTTVTPTNIPAGDFAVARASTVSDADGTRTSTLLVPSGTTAEMIMDDGSRRALTSLSLRQTEFTVGDSGEAAMPAGLPPQSAYTYAVDLSVDQARSAGADSVVFSRPLWNYVENFLGFPAGTAVPAGYYDYNKAAWIASDNGLVVAVVTETSGLADVDITGDGVADTGAPLAAIGMTDAEQRHLATLYNPGQSLWRVPITHFSPWDYNWGFGFPAGAIYPFIKLLDAAAGVLAPNCTSSGSIIGCEDQTLGEQVDLTGTGVDLAYSSLRAPGSQARSFVNVAVSPATIPASLKRIEVQLEIVGRRVETTLPAVPNQRFTYEWDGIDSYGRRLQGDQPATIRVGYVYEAGYVSARNFASFGGGDISVDLARREPVLWQTIQTTVAAATVSDARGAGLGGWTLSAHHSFDPRSKTIALGDGSTISVPPQMSAIDTIAGNGQAGFAGDNGPATAASLATPGGAVVDAAGNVYVADQLNDRIRKITPDNKITTIAGNGVFGFGGDNGPATVASFASPLELALDAAGNLYVADVDNHRIRRIATNGTITTVAGNGTRGDSGDGGPATAATLAEPTGVAVAPSGDLYIADFAAHRVRRIATDGTITTLAGTGVSGYSGDGGLASAARLNEPSALAVDAAGNVYIADSGNERVRRVGPDGTITTVAGTGVFGTTGDGGSAIAARLAIPTGLAIDTTGNLYIAEQGSHRVRQVTPDGTITTLAGSRVRGFDGDAGAAVNAELANSRALAFSPDGAVYIADADNHRIRRVHRLLADSGLDAIVVPAPDGSVVFEFNNSGRHLRTLDALTGVELLRFAYDSGGRLASITDTDGNATTIERPGTGRVDIVAPFGQRTILALNADGWAERITDPAGQSQSVTYGPDGLLTSFVDAKGSASTYTYDALGRLTAAAGRDNKVTTLTRTEVEDGYRVAVATPMGRTTTYDVTQRGDGTLARRVTDPTGLVSNELRTRDGTTSVDIAGSSLTQVAGPDPRWGMSAPVPATATAQAPGKALVASSTTRAVTLANPDNPLSLTTRTDVTTIGTRTWRSVYDAATRTITSTSPQGRVSKVTLDAKARVVRSETPGLEPVAYTYDAKGRVETITQGTGTTARITRSTYDTQGRLATVTDALGRVTTYSYDAADRVTSVNGPGGVASATYDQNGNLATITPPGRTASSLTAAVDDRLVGYTPAGGVGAASYQLNDDRQ